MLQVITHGRPRALSGRLPETASSLCTWICIGLLSAAVFPQALLAQQPEEAGEHLFGLRISIAREDGVPVVDRAWLEQQVRWANSIFSPSGVAFRIAEARPLGASHTRMESRADRHSLGAELADGLINVFVVASLRDVDEPSRFRMGVHWRPRDRPGSHLVIISRIAAPTVLAHELGHFFGNRRHPEIAGNIMSYNRGDAPPSFDDAQLSRIRRSAQQFCRTGQLQNHR